MQSFASLWQEFRKRLLIGLTSLIIIALILLPFANHLFAIFAKPLINSLDKSQNLIATGILSGFWIPIELSLWFALLLSMPIFLWQCWAFAKPALRKSEKFWWKVYLTSSLGLFVLGLAFAYFVVLPICLQVLIKATPSLVRVMPDIVNYLNFSFRLMLLFAIACQLPVIILLLCQFKLVTLIQLKLWRRYAIISAFIIGMIIAPDIISQCFLAIPLCFLFELGIFLVSLCKLAP